MGERKTLTYVGKSLRDFTSLTYVFVVATGAAIALYLLSASKFSLTLYTVLRLFLTDVEPWVAYILSLVISYSPIIAIFLLTFNSLRKEVRLTSAVGYSYLLYAIATKTFNVTIPVAGVASLGINSITLELSVNILYVVVAIASFTVLIIVSYLGKSTVWAEISSYIREGGRLIPLGKRAMQGGSQVSVLPGRSLVIVFSGLSSVLHKIFINVVPPTLWEIKTVDKGHTIEVELVPKGIGESSVTVSYEDRILSRLRVVAGSMRGFAKLMIESIISGKRSKIIETEHPAGMPLFYTLERISGFLPYKSVSPHRLSAYLIDDTGMPKEIRLDYSLFEPGKTYHIVIKKRGAPTPSTPSLVAGVSEGEIIKIPLTAMTEEYTAKPSSINIVSAPIDKSGKPPVSSPQSIGWDSLRELCGDVW